MKKIGMLLLAGLLPVLLSTPLLAAETAAPVVSDAWISEAPPVAKVNAAYVVVKNGAQKDALLRVETQAAESAEIHRMSMAGGLMRMEPMPRVNLAPGAVLRMAPGGMHIMLVNMKRPLKVGDRVPLTLVFRQAGRLTVEAVVRPLEVDGGMPEHAHH